MFSSLMSRICLVVVVAASVALASLPHEPAAAQGERDYYVDVGLILEVPRTVSGGVSYDLDIIVTNAGSGTAYDVEVVVEVISPDKSYLHYPPLEMPTTGQVFFSSDRRTLRWVIPELGELQRVESTARVRHSEYGTGGITIFENVDHPHELFGRVTTPSFESDLHMGNNTSRVWSYNYRGSNQDGFIQAGGNYAVEVSTSEWFPTPGSITNFTVTTDRSQHVFPGTPTPPIDLKVDIELTEGLSVAGAPTYTSGALGTSTVPSSVNYSNGVFTVGTLKKGDPVRNSLTLPVRLARGATASEQCLTATLTGNPPPGIGPDDDAISNNVARACLGVPPDRTVVFNSGETGLPTWYNCVGRTTYPCSAADSVEIVTLGGSAAIDAGSTHYEVFKPDEVVIQVTDPLGRATNSEEGSTGLVWSTGYGTGVVVRPGVILSEELVSLDPSEWGVDVDNDGTRAITLNVEVSGPGKLATWAYDDDDDDPPYEWFGYATNGVLSESGTWFVDSGSYPWYAEFSELGTYRVDFDGEIAANNGTPTDTADDTTYAIAERTYVFHVGPIADLEVKAAVAGAMTAKDQVAFTVTATNHGPENRAPDVRVPVTLPSGMRFVRADSEDYDPQTGVWDIGELKVKGFRHSLRQPESETLTIVAELTGDVTEPVKGSIKNHQDYCVRIKTGGTPSDDLPCDGSAVPTGDTYTKHSTIYYDYQPANNEFSLSADWKAVAAKNPPYLTGPGLSITSTPTPNVNGPGSYLIGDVIEVEARFSKVVYVTGSPRLRLQIGNEEREAEYAGGSGTDTLRFQYTVGQWDRDDNGVSIPANPFVLRGNPIRDGDGNDAMLDHAGLPDQAGHPVGGPGTPQQRPEPQAAGRLTATAGDGYVDLKWPAAPDPDKVFYQLWRNDDPTWWEIAPRVMGSDRGYTVTGLDNGAEYIFRVRAHYKYEHGDTPGPASAPVAAVPRASDTRNSPPEFDQDTAWPATPYCVNAGASGGEVARVSAYDQDGDRLNFYLIDGPWEGLSNHFSVTTARNGDAYQGVIRVARTIPRNHDGTAIIIDLEVNDGRGGMDQIGVDLQYDPTGRNCQGTGSRSTEPEERGPSVLAAVRTWAGAVRNWWAGFWAWTDWGGHYLAARPR